MDLKQQAAAKAIELIRDQTTLGLGGGASVAYVINFLIQEKRGNLRVASSSPVTRTLLQRHGFTPLQPSSLDKLDLYIDGCDQVDGNLNVLKSLGGIHTQEKLMASMAREFVVLATGDKWVDSLGGACPLTLEVIPEARSYVPARIRQLFADFRIRLRLDEETGEATVTTNGNLLFDLWFSSWPQLERINPMMKEIAGMVETSLFFKMASKAIVADPKGVAMHETLASTQLIAQTKK